VVNFLPLDIADRQSRESFCQFAPDKIDYLVHCAGFCPREAFLEMTEEIWDKVVSINLKGPLFLTQALYPQMQKAGHSSVCFVTSLAGRFGGRGSSVAYTASKAGLDAAMKALAKFGADKVSCFSVAPGPTNTEMMKSLPHEEISKIKSATITGEICEPEEVAQLIVDCLGRRGQTGQVIDINHGMFIP
jgi:3-oxoacyl-[acyl-carrier protein] reductase